MLINLSTKERDMLVELLQYFNANRQVFQHYHSLTAWVDDPGYELSELKAEHTTIEAPDRSTFRGTTLEDILAKIIKADK